LICVTQINESKLFNRIISQSELSNKSFNSLQWYQIIDMLKYSLKLNPETAKKSEKSILHGKVTNRAQRTGDLFIKELEIPCMKKNN